jgi:hypothetical protein
MIADDGSIRIMSGEAVVEFGGGLVVFVDVLSDGNWQEKSGRGMVATLSGEVSVDLGDWPSVTLQRLSKKATNHWSKPPLALLGWSKYFRRFA